jgi:hypothetical protein
VSTRSVIARPTPDGGFHGTYCHYDGYPAHQGRVLFDAVTSHFDGDTDAACTYLIDQHPAGWSVLHGDFNAPPGYRHPTDPNDRRNQCYCHGDRHDPPRPPLDDHTARAAWVDYAYVIGPDRLQVLTPLAGGWQPVAEPSWTDTPTGTPSTPTPTTCAASTDPATPGRRPRSIPTSTASTLAGATSGRGVQGRGASPQGLQPDAAWWLRHYVADALKQSNLAMVAAGSLS